MTHPEHGSNVAYYEAIADIYSLFFRDFEKSMNEEGAWLDDVLRPYGAHRVLDASCGSGRQCLPLMQRGYEVLAADPSQSMLREAKVNAARRGLRPNFVRAAFVDLPQKVRSEFDAVIALGNSLCNVQRPDEILSALKAFRRCLRMGGICIVGIKDFDHIRIQRRRFHGHAIADKDNRRTILFEVWDFEDPLLHSTAFVIEGVIDETGASRGRWSTRSAQTHEYMLGCEELEALAHNAGFSSVRRLDHRCEAAYALEP